MSFKRLALAVERCDQLMLAEAMAAFEAKSSAGRFGSIDRIIADFVAV